MARLVAAPGASHSIMPAAGPESRPVRCRASGRRILGAHRDGEPVGCGLMLARTRADAESCITPEAITRRFQTLAPTARPKRDIAALSATRPERLFAIPQPDRAGRQGLRLASRA